MIDYQDLEDRIASLERTVRNIGIGQDLVVGDLHILAEKLLFVRADKDDDGDYDPLTAAAWENSTKSGTGTINWNSVFGVPTAARAVMVAAHIEDGVVSTRFYLKAKSTTSQSSVNIRTQEASVLQDTQAVVAVSLDGTSYYNFSAEADSFYLRVIGWFV